MLTEKQAWEFCAKAFENVDIRNRQAYCKREVVIREDLQGLCDVIVLSLRRFEKIDKAISSAMLDKIQKVKSKSMFKWPITKSGAKLRVKFCREQIRKLESDGK